MKKDAIIHAGLPALVALAIAGDAGTIIPAGNSQLTATPMGTRTTCYSPATNANTGIILEPGAQPGDMYYAFNHDNTNAMKLYPPVGGQLNGLAINTAISIAANKGAIVKCLTPLLFGVTLSA